MNSFDIISILSGSKGIHQLGDAFPCHRESLRLFPFRAKGVGTEADPVIEEDFFKGPGGIGLKGGGGELFPGIPGFGIPDPEN